MLFVILQKTSGLGVMFLTMYKSISEKCASVKDYEVISMNEFVPMGNPQGKYKFLKDLVVHARHARYTHSTGKLNLDFIWKVPTDDSVEDVKETDSCLSHARHEKGFH